MKKCKLSNEELVPLYEVLLSRLEFENKLGHTFFICNEIELLHQERLYYPDLHSDTIRPENCKQLLYHFRTQLPGPNKYPEFFNHERFEREDYEITKSMQNNTRNAWFLYNSNEVRINFIKAIINKLKSEL